MEQLDRDVDLSQAISKNRLYLESQAIVDINGRFLLGHERLIRLRSGNGECVRPQAFLPQAEKGGGIIQLDRWVIKQAMREAHLFRGAHHRQFINISVKSTGDPALVRLIERELVARSLDPRQFVFELTETAYGSITQTARVLQDIKALGCGVALDDFGSGFSNLEHVLQLPFDYLKIAGKFVSHLPEKMAFAVVKAITDIGQSLGSKIIAEYVSDELRLQLLLALGVNYIQGALADNIAVAVTPYAQNLGISV